MSRPLSRTRSHIPEEQWTSPSKFSKYSKPMGMPTPPRPSRKEFTGRDTYNHNGSYEDSRNEASSFYRGESTPSRQPVQNEEDFIGNARDYVSRMRSVSGVETPTSGLPRSEPRRGLQRSISEYDDSRYESRHYPSPGRQRLEDRTPTYGEPEDNMPSKYEIMGMKEQLKKHESTRLHLEEALENAISEKVSIENRLRDEMLDLSRAKEEEMERLHKKYNEQSAEQRSKLVETFKDDMMEMKVEWENAFTRLKEEAEGTKRALLQELESASDAKVDLETRLGEVTSEYKARIEEEKDNARERIEEVKKSKEEDLERLREMYEEHLESLKSKQEDERMGLKDEIQILLEENEKIKVCYENLEEEMDRAKRELHDMTMKSQAAISDNVNYEKEIEDLKNEVDDLLDENDKLKRSVHESREETKDVRMDLDRLTKENGRIHTELNRVSRDLDEVEQERNALNKDYRELQKKVETMEEERELETRYTEALVKQRDNMSNIIENCQAEIEELKSSQQDYDDLKAEYGNTAEELDHARNELKKMKGMKDELAALSSKTDSLQRERERYNATVKALKVDLRAIHQQNVGTETSLQEHMRILNEKWQDTGMKLEKIKTLEDELSKSMTLLDQQENERELMAKDYENRLERLRDDFEGSQSELVKVSSTCMHLQNKSDELALTTT